MKLFYALFFVACLLAGIGIVAIARQSYSETYSLSLPPRYYSYNSVYMLGTGHVSGGFSESQGQPVTFYVFNQQEFDTYKTGGGIASFIFSIANVPSGTYQADIQSAGRYYLVIISDSDQTTEQITQNFTATQSNLPYLGLESLAGISLILLIVSFRVRARENRRIISSILKANPNFGPGQGEADDRILVFVKDLSRQLGLGFEPLRLDWIAWFKFGGVKVVPSDQPLIGVRGKARGSVFMPAILRGRLETNEWVPLVASSLIYGFNPSIRRKWARLKRLWQLTLVGYVVVFAVFFSLRFVFPVNDISERLLLDTLLPILALLGAFVVTFLPRKINMSNRNHVLEADRIAAQITGKEQMLQTLKKIDSMNLSDVEERKKERPTIWRKAGVLPFPSITLRIQQLETEKS